ncbi:MULTISPECIES: hypothetical protein [Marinomonas]|uniref:Uncharacterized protein n=1 Tax=Marinomonas rhodophyticola TaxID=2992803 RepID=A0ABT3KB98_9GAMM|nr:hypothetical protein [Marinomonas sp. KJ51-3]MCW4627810.1 hypothetical protein [Marinomonas sp. KJ51-3]
MTNKTLSEKFQSTMGQPVEIEGRNVYPIYILELEKEKQITVKWVSTQSRLKQGIQIKIDKGVIEVNGEKLSNIVLWEDTSPDVVQLRCIPKKNTKLKVWNVWEVNGVTQAWVGNAGMDISESDHQIRLRCSDGSDDVNFQNVVVELVAD